MDRSHILAPLRVAILGVVLLLALLTVMFLRGPAFWQRSYYPLHYRAQIAASASRHGVNPYLVAAVINAESRWNPARRSRAGAVGLMQVMPATAKDLAKRGQVDGARFSAANLSDPGVNIEYGAAYLRYLIGRYHEMETAVAAYNAGIANADRWKVRGGNIRDAIDYPETRHFVLEVSRGRDRYRALYPNTFEGWSVK